MNNDVNILMKALQKMPENDMTKEAIIPLLECIGYKKVEFYGGTNEEGKDIVFWETSKIGRPKLCLAQVKHFKLTNTASDSNSLQTIINQLIMCFEKKILSDDKLAYSPKEVFLISSYPINSKTLQTRFSENPSLPARNIEIIDGEKLASLLLEYDQPIVNKILKKDIDFTSYFSSSINNKILLKAIGFHENVEIKNIYTDIDFSLGKTTTKLFFSSKFLGSKKQINIDQIDWDQFKDVIINTDSQFGNDYINLSIKQIEDAYKKTVQALAFWNKEIKKLDVIIKSKTNIREEQKNQDELNKNISNQKDEKTKQNFKIEDEEQETTEIVSLRNKLNNLEKEKPVLKYSFELNGEVLSKKLDQKRNQIEQKIKLYNQSIPHPDELKDFVKECKMIIDSSSIILSNKILAMNLFGTKKISYREDLEKTRLKMPIDKIFDTRQNIILLGEAGAGKTTCLQMYAINNKSNENCLFVWAPLANIIQSWKQKNIEIIITDKEIIEQFDSVVFEYLLTKNISLTTEEIKDIFQKKKSTLLFDGFDEAIRNHPWLPKAIVKLTSKYLNAQVIVSSRISGQFIDEIPFFTVTLLPFTNVQRNEFIKKWFSGKIPNEEQTIKKHLENNEPVSIITRNPLLVTTLCVIASHKLPLPQTEVKLYNERIRLLTGYYDNVKNIDTRITITPLNLKLLAQKIAYHMQSKAIREMFQDQLETESISLMKDYLNAESSKKALNELIDPCNILVPMSSDGKFGFGHLRYQEHLCAIELRMNRNLDIERLLTIEWWLDTLLLFAHMSDSIEWLVKKIHYQIGIKKVRKTIDSMVLTRPKNEQELINKYINKITKEANEFNMSVNDEDDEY